MSLMTETVFEAVALDGLAGDRDCPARCCAPGPVVERLSGERGDVLAWLTTRASALRDEGCAMRRARYRQRRHSWAGKIAYESACRHAGATPASFPARVGKNEPIADS